MKPWHNERGTVAHRSNASSTTYVAACPCCEGGLAVLGCRYGYC